MDARSDLVTVAMSMTRREKTDEDLSGHLALNIPGEETKQVSILVFTSTVVQLHVYRIRQASTCVFYLLQDPLDYLDNQIGVSLVM